MFFFGKVFKQKNCELHTELSTYNQSPAKILYLKNLLQNMQTNLKLQTMQNHIYIYIYTDRQLYVIIMINVKVLYMSIKIRNIKMEIYIVQLSA